MEFFPELKNRGCKLDLSEVNQGIEFTYFLTIYVSYFNENLYSTCLLLQGIIKRFILY